MKKIIVICLVLTFFCSCKRTQFVQANLDKPENAPAYTVDVDANKSPNQTAPTLHGS